MVRSVEPIYSNIRYPKIEARTDERWALENASINNRIDLILLIGTNSVRTASRSLFAGLIAYIRSLL